MAQTRKDRESIIRNLPPETIRVSVVTDQGKQIYKAPVDVDLDLDEIQLSLDGSPIIMRGKPGRPQKSTLPPATPMVAVVSAVREDHIANNPVLQDMGKNPEGEDTFNTILRGLAEEAASVEFDRIETQRNGLDSSGHATKRARILKSMADLMLKRKQQQEGGMIDLDSPVFMALFTFILQTLRGAMEDAGARQELIETTFSKLVVALTDNAWREEAKSKMKDKIK